LAGALTTAGAFVFVTAAPSPASNAASSSLDGIGPPPTRKILSQCWQRLGLPDMLSRMSISFPQVGQFVLKGMAGTSEADGMTYPRRLASRGEGVSIVCPYDAGWREEMQRESGRGPASSQVLLLRSSAGRQCSSSDSSISSASMAS